MSEAQDSQNNPGGKIDAVSNRHARSKIQEVSEHANKALEFLSTYGLVAESLKVPPLLARPFSDDAASKNEDTVDLRVLYFLIGQEWRMVGSLDMTDPTQKCPNSWQKFTSPRPSCGKKTGVPCDSLNMTTSGASYQKVCGRFRGYQRGSPGAFNSAIGLGYNIERYYVDGVTVTYGSPGKRHHVFTYAAGYRESITHGGNCPCTGGGNPPPSFVGSDYYCESGNPGPGVVGTDVYYSDVLWDGQECGGDEVTCCNPPDLPWFCKTFPTPISEDLEVRICTDESLNNENVLIEIFELYIQVAIPPMNIQAVSVFNSNNTLRHLEISWIPVGGNVTTYTVRVVGTDRAVGEACTVCTATTCLYVHQITQITKMTYNYSVLLRAIKPDGTSGLQNSTTIYGPTNSIFRNASFFSYDNSIGCSFLRNQSFYCMVCCSTDPTVPPDSSVHNISTTKGTEVNVSLQGLTSDQMYYCKAAATNTNSTKCTGPVVGGVKIYFSSIPPTKSTDVFLTSIDVIGITIASSFVVFFSLGALVVTCCCCCVMKKRTKDTPHPPDNEPLAYEMSGMDEKMFAI
ncbi:hypothetical protein EMCRGX_G022626 [Ephydatia muelleri]